MKKIIILLTIFVLNQFYTDHAWAEQPSAGIKKSTDVQDVIIPEKKPTGMSDFEWEKLKAKKPLPYDRGAMAIDISKYSKEMQETYNFFTKKCSECHTIARPINAPHVGEEWKTYLTKMMKKPGAKISPMDAGKIYKFLVYDSKIRKKGKRNVEILVTLKNIKDSQKAIELIKGLEEVKKVSLGKDNIIVVSDLAFTDKSDVEKLLNKDKIEILSIKNTELKHE